MLSLKKVFCPLTPPPIIRDTQKMSQDRFRQSPSVCSEINALKMTIYYGNQFSSDMKIAVLKYTRPEQKKSGLVPVMFFYTFNFLQHHNN